MRAAPGTFDEVIAGGEEHPDVARKIEALCAGTFRARIAPTILKPQP